MTAPQYEAWWKGQMWFSGTEAQVREYVERMGREVGDLGRGWTVERVDVKRKAVKS